MTRLTKRFSFVFVCSAVSFIAACSDDDDDHSAASSAGAAGVTGAAGSETTATGGSPTGGAHTGGTNPTGGRSTGGQNEAGSTAEGGSTGEGGAAGQPVMGGAEPGGAAGSSAATGGSAGQDQGTAGAEPQGGSAGQESAPSAGQGGQGGTKMSVAEACTIQCQAQQDLTVSAAGAAGTSSVGESCYSPDDCEPFCVDPLDPGSFDPATCPTEYTAMVLCQAQLTPEQWYCSDWDPGDLELYMPAPVEGTDCEDEVCDWTCCEGEGSFLVMPEVYERCDCAE
ncbi:MAG: hypothetical protein JW940_27655 [Polyangiaceae bacterium]|nr:hypothetical protein [Polyangiaceae bacterium]